MHLVIFRHPPFYSSSRESLDMALALAAFDLPVQLLFCEQAVWCLGRQDADSIQHKDLSKMLSALGLYDIEQVFVSQECLHTANLHREQLHLAATALSSADIAALIAAAQTVIRL